MKVHHVRSPLPAAGWAQVHDQPVINKSSHALARRGVGAQMAWQETKERRNELRAEVGGT